MNADRRPPDAPSESVEIADALASFTDRTCLIVEDDDAFRDRLSSTLARLSFIVTKAQSVQEARGSIERQPPAFAVIDLRLQDGSGLELAETLHQARPGHRSIILTGYGTLPMAVSAMKVGVQNVLTKPADIEDIVNALTAEPGKMPMAPEHPTPPDQVRWDHIQSVFELCNRNVSETARQLKMHRRTLQRILLKQNSSK